MSVITHPRSATISQITARAVDVPLDKPLRTGSGSIPSAPLVLIDLRTDGGVVGRSYVFCYTSTALRALRALIEDLGRELIGVELAPREISARLQARFKLLGAQGLVAMAIAGIDMALWDALALSHDVPLCELLGGTRCAIPAYASLGLMSADETIVEANASLEAGFTAVKFKLGGPRLADDVALVRAVREAVCSSVELMVDYNQALDRAEAVRRGRALEPFGLRWIEEPCRADDDESHALVADTLTTPVQIGENWWGPNDAARSIRMNACDEMMLDVMKIGGVTGWLEASALATTSNRRVSSHLFPEISAHLLCVTPSARYLEWLDLASTILVNPVRPVHGTMTPSGEPGSGLHWDERAVRRHQID